MERATAGAKTTRVKVAKRVAATYVPVPPGITYWERVAILTAEGEREVWSPSTRPLAACSSSLTDEDVRALLTELTQIALQRGLGERDR
jgi:hypothetical protein